VYAVYRRYRGVLFEVPTVPCTGVAGYFVFLVPALRVTVVCCVLGIRTCVELYSYRMERSLCFHFFEKKKNGS